MTCLNCGAEVGGAFCAACGQKADGAHLELWGMLREGVDEFLHLDGKIATTLKVLVSKPGQLTTDMVAGRRARYVSPIRLYVTLAIVYFFLVAVTEGQDLDGRGDVFVARFQQVVLTLLMPVFALLTFFFYRARQPYFVAHLYHSLYLHSFVFLLFSVGFVVAAVVPLGRALTVGVGATVVAYHALALKRVFGEPLGKTLLKGAAIAALYAVVAAASLAGLLFTL
jgi:hypothetical protein